MSLSARRKAQRQRRSDIWSTENISHQASVLRTQPDCNLGHLKEFYCLTPLKTSLLEIRTKREQLC